MPRVGTDDQQQQREDDELNVQTLGDEAVEDEGEVSAGDPEAAAAFAASFNSERGNTPSEDSPANASTTDTAGNAAAADAGTTEGKAAAAAPAKDTPAQEDPWKDVNPKVRETLQQLSEQMGVIPKLEHRLKSAEGRIAAAKTGAVAARETQAAGGEAPDQKQIEAAANAGGAKWDKLKDDWPEWAAALEERLQALPGTTPQHIDVDALTAQITERLATAAPQFDPEVVVQHAVTEMKHPGWKRTIKTPEFRDWYRDATPELKALGASDSAADAIALLDHFAEVRERGNRQQQNKSRLDHAVTPRGTGGGAANTQSAEQAFASGFNKVRSGGR